MLRGPRSAASETHMWAPAARRVLSSESANNHAHTTANKQFGWTERRLCVFAMGPQLIDMQPVG
jgi:hypothetical protein